MKDNYSVTIKGFVEFKESENSTCVATISFGIVMHNCETALQATKGACARLCENLNISQNDFELTHIDCIPASER